MASALFSQDGRRCWQSAVHTIVIDTTGWRANREIRVYSSNKLNVSAPQLKSHPMKWPILSPPPPHLPQEIANFYKFLPRLFCHSVFPSIFLVPSLLVINLSTVFFSFFKIFFFLPCLFFYFFIPFLVFCLLLTLPVFFCLSACLYLFSCLSFCLSLFFIIYYYYFIIYLFILFSVFLQFFFTLMICYIILPNVSIY